MTGSTVVIVHDVTMANDDQPHSHLPDFLTVEEAAKVLRIGRTAAYEQTRRYEQTDGEAGIPVIRVGRLMRVPRAALERWNGGPLGQPTRQRNAEPASPSDRQLHRRRQRLQQDGLPFSE